jgi:hypothetical protein
MRYVLSLVVCLFAVSFVCAGSTPKVDPYSGAVIQMQDAHARIHVSEMYKVSATTATLANNATASFLIDLTASTTAQLHIVFDCNVGGLSLIELYESATFNSSGTVSSIVNLNRDHANTMYSSVKCYANPLEVTSLGTLLASGYTQGGATAQARPGTLVSPGAEWVLNPGSTYLIRITNSSGGNIAVSTGVEIYLNIY